MNKRILFYFLALIATFFLVHEWNDYANRNAGAPSKLDQITIDPSLRPTKELTAQDRIDFNLVSLYSDPELTQFVCYAVQQNLLYVTLAWAEQLPEHLYARHDITATANIDQLTLRVKPEVSGDPVLYSIYPNQKLQIPHAPLMGTFPIALVSFPPKGQNPEVIFGEATDKGVVTLSALPTTPMLVLYKAKDNQYYPNGTFDPTTGKLSAFVDDPDFEAHALVIYPESKEISTELQQHPYYALETPYQQIVFSLVGGAITEINLPFQTKENTNSVVRAIDFDRIMQKMYPTNATFPQYPYQVAGADNVPENKQPQLGGYYPLLRRNIIGPGARASTTFPPHYYGMSIITAEAVPEVFIYTLTRLEKNLIEFELVQSNRKITKTYTLPPDPHAAPYCLDLAIKIEGDARGLIVTPGVPEVELISGSFTPTLKYQAVRAGKSFVENVGPPKQLVEFSQVQIDWLCNGNGFFGVIMDPLYKTMPGLAVHPLSGEVVPSRLTLIDSEYNRFPAEKYPGYEMHLPIYSAAGTTHYRIFAGPFDKAILERVDHTYTDPDTGESPNYISCQSFNGWFAFISEPFAKFLFILMSLFYKLTGSWGFSIIMLTIALRLMLYPLNTWSIKSTLKLQQLAPKITAIQEKYKKEPKHAQLEIMQLYRDKGVNPFSGCLPLLIQMPFLIGMFDLLKSTFDLRGASFIPYWIDNLTAPDVLFSWGYPLPFFGNSFHLLPILLGAVMYIQQWYSSSSALVKGGKLSDQQRQQKFMGNIMVIVFTVMFYHFPSGLNIYWLSSMSLGILQQWWVTKQMKAKSIS